MESTKEHDINAMSTRDSISSVRIKDLVAFKYVMYDAAYYANAIGAWTNSRIVADVLMVVIATVGLFISIPYNVGGILFATLIVGKLITLSLINPRIIVLTLVSNAGHKVFTFSIVGRIFDIALFMIFVASIVCYLFNLGYMH